MTSRSNRWFGWQWIRLDSKMIRGSTQWRHSNLGLSAQHFLVAPSGWLSGGTGHPHQTHIQAHRSTNTSEMRSFLARSRRIPYTMYSEHTPVRRAGIRNRGCIRPPGAFTLSVEDTMSSATRSYFGSAPQMLRYTVSILLTATQPSVVRI